MNAQEAKFIGHEQAKGDNMEKILLRISGPRKFDVIFEKKGPFVGKTQDVIGTIRYGSDKLWWFESCTQSGTPISLIQEVLLMMNERPMIDNAKSPRDDKECSCPCHYGGYDGTGACKQPCEKCDDPDSVCNMT